MKTKVKCPGCEETFALVGAGKRGQWRLPDHEVLERGAMRRCNGAGLVVAERDAMFARYAGLEVRDVDSDD